MCKSSRRSCNLSHVAEITPGTQSGWTQEPNFERTSLPLRRPHRVLDCSSFHRTRENGRGLRRVGPNSYAFVKGMRMKRQDNVVALVHKETEGERPLRESVPFQYEVPSIGLAAWGQGFWSPLVVLIDLLGICKHTSRAAKTVVSRLQRG